MATASAAQLSDKKAKVYEGSKDPKRAAFYEKISQRDMAPLWEVLKDLVAKNMRGGAVEAGDTFVMLQVPDDEKVLEGAGEQTVARVILYDNKAKRASAQDEATLLVLRAQKKPLNVLLLIGIGGGVVVILLLVLVLVRGGGGGGGVEPGADYQGPHRYLR